MGSSQLGHTTSYIRCYATPVQLMPCQILLLYFLYSNNSVSNKHVSSDVQDIYI